ncbi:hypothetical protein ACK36Q_02580 [Aeromonas veronii]
MSDEFKDIVIFGYSSYTKSIISLCEKIERTNVLAICVDDSYLSQLPSLFNGIQIVGFSEALCKYSDAHYALAIGYKNMRSRKVVYERLKKHNLEVATLVSPNSFISTENIGNGCIIFDGVVIEHDVCLHENVTIWSNATICHDVNIGAHCFIAASTTIGGFSQVGELSFIGFNSTLIDEVKVGKECLVGSCSLINTNINDYSKCYGIPARIIQSIDKETGVFVS